MGILTLGLLGVAALFPVGGFYMQKADIADRSSAIAQSVMSDIVARGMLNPRAWVAHNRLNDTFDPDLSYAGLVGGQLSSLRGTNPANLWFANTLAGSVVVLDPLGVAYYMSSPDLSATSTPLVWACNFPGKGRFYFGYKSKLWAPWKRPSDFFGPVRRVTLADARGTMGAEIADTLFRSIDDLASDLPPRDDRPATQNWDIADLGNGPTPLARQWQGDYSWIVTIVPSCYEARNALGSNPSQFYYNVSVVVFYKRELGTIRQGTRPDSLYSFSPSEVLVAAAAKSTGLNGGELLLTSEPTTVQSFDGLKSGQWVMLFGPHPGSTDVRPMLYLNWYQVVAVDEHIQSDDVDAYSEQRYVTLRGPEWPWNPAANVKANQLANDLCVGIFDGAVAVHTKTLRLEGPGGSAWSITTPPGATPPNGIGY